MDQQDKLKFQKEIIVFSQQKAIWEVIIGYFFITSSIYIFYYFINYLYKYGFHIEEIELLVSLFSISIVFFIKGLKHTLNINIHFNFNKLKFKKEYSLSFLKFGKWEELPVLEYLSVFDKGDNYIIKLWYFKNKNFVLFNDYYDREEALKVAIEIAEKLNLKVLDATERDKKNTWIS